jgi:glycerophosphoryl diester phosphodiesterase
VLAVAHRTPGTAAACRELADLGVGIFEVDVQVVRGGVVVSHFLPLVRGYPGLRRDRWTLSRGARAEPLDAVLARLPAAARVLVDLKTESPAAARAVAAALSREPDRWYASCKRWELLTPVEEAGVRTWRSIATRRALAAALHPDRLGDARPVTVRHTFLDRRTVHRLRQVTPEVIAWTVNDLRRAGQLADLGVTGLTSDNPRVHAYAASR